MNCFLVLFMNAGLYIHRISYVDVYRVSYDIWWSLGPNFRWRLFPKEPLDFSYILVTEQFLSSAASPWFAEAWLHILCRAIPTMSTEWNWTQSTPRRACSPSWWRMRPCRGRSRGLCSGPGRAHASCVVVRFPVPADPTMYSYPLQWAQEWNWTQSTPACRQLWPVVEPGHLLPGLCLWHWRQMSVCPASLPAHFLLPELKMIFKVMLLAVSESYSVSWESPYTQKYIYY